jgi:hypothetical protein
MRVQQWGSHTAGSLAREEQLRELEGGVQFAGCLEAMQEGLVVWQIEA